MRDFESDTHWGILLIFLGTVGYMVGEFFFQWLAKGV